MKILRKGHNHEAQLSWRKRDEEQKQWQNKQTPHMTPPTHQNKKQKNKQKKTKKKKQGELQQRNRPGTASRKDYRGLNSFGAKFQTAFVVCFFLKTNYRLERSFYVKLKDWMSNSVIMSRLIWSYAVCKSLLLSPVTVKELLEGPFSTCWRVWTLLDELLTNSIAPDQTPRPVLSDLVLHCLLLPLCPSTYGKYVRQR